MLIHTLTHAQVIIHMYVTKKEVKKKINKLKNTIPVSTKRLIDNIVRS